QWGVQAGTVLKVLEQALVYDATLSTTTDSSSPFSLKNVAQRIDQQREQSTEKRKNDTYVINKPLKPDIPNIKFDAEPEKLVNTDLIVQDLDRTVTPNTKSSEEKIDLFQGLFTGQFDAKNKKLLRTVSNPELHKLVLVEEKPNRSLSDVDHEEQEQSSERKLSLPLDNKSANNQSEIKQSLSNTIIKSDHEPTFIISGSSDESEHEEEEEDMKTLRDTLASYLVENDDEEDNKNSLDKQTKHSSSEPVIVTKSKDVTHKRSANNSITADDIDDDDVWCNEEDEENLVFKVKFDLEKEEELRKILGNETLEIVREALKRVEADTQTIASLVPEDKRHLLNSDALLTLLSMNVGQISN
ncbi:unnamed protein product, partial [Didymodactylos carnosus]